MKKTLVAIAALAAATGAMAQSSVTMYGNVDQSVYSAKQANGQSVLSSASNGGTTSLFGLTGKEAVGNGTTVEFDLKSELTLMTGQIGSSGSTATKTSIASNAQATMFNRGAWVGLNNAAWGDFKVGRQNDALWEQAGKYNNTGINSFGWNNLTATATTLGGANTFTGKTTGAAANNGLGSNVAADILAGSSANNPSASGTGTAFAAGLSYATPTFNGLQAKYFSSAKTTYEDMKGEGARTSGSVTYNQGPVSVAYGLSKLNDVNGDTGAKVSLLAGSYTMGQFKFVAGQQKTKFGGLWASTQDDMTVTGYGVGYTAGQMEYNLGFTTLKNDETAGYKTTQTGLTARYNMTKRTSVYAGVGTSNNEGTSNRVGAVYGGAGLTPAANGGTTGTNSAYLVGLRHQF
jgi:predicted porin